MSVEVVKFKPPTEIDPQIVRLGSVRVQLLLRSAPGRLTPVRGGQAL